MAFSKKTYTSGQTAITADNLNAIQDELIRVGGVASSVADFIVEIGGYQNTTWTKYNSGIAKCSGFITITPNSNKTEGSGYWENFHITYPPNLFIYTPQTVVTVDNSSYVVLATISSVHSSGEAGGYVWAPLQGAFNGTRTYRINFYAQGYWK